MLGSRNATLITLIPKRDSPETFSTFMPIALCNLVYKMVTKIIIDRIKPMLSKYISKEKFDVLDNRHIIDAIGTTQECLHSVKTTDISLVIMNLDLAKAYNKVN